LVAQEYPFATQTQIISAVALLHNFIIMNDPDEISILDDIEPEASLDDSWSLHQSTVPHDERTRAARRRDRIADEMWTDYNARPARRRR
jgi:hypothetical protein